MSPKISHLPKVPELVHPRSAKGGERIRPSEIDDASLDRIASDLRAKWDAEPAQDECIPVPRAAASAATPAAG